MTTTQRYRYQESLEMLRNWSTSAEAGESSLRLEWDREKQKLHALREDGSREWSFRFPLPFPPASEKISFEDYLATVPETPPPYLLILIQAGHSAFGYFEEGKAVHHKVVKKYMVRAKQGKSQINYLGSRGKSKAGSRVRLANTISFFEDINTKITDWDIMDETQRILISCPVRMRPMLFQSKVPPPFGKDDPRLMKVPLDTQKPDLEELLRINRRIIMGEMG